MFPGSMANLRNRFLKMPDASVLYVVLNAVTSSTPENRDGYQKAQMVKIQMEIEKRSVA